MLNYIYYPLHDTIVNFRVHVVTHFYRMNLARCGDLVGKVTWVVKGLWLFLSGDLSMKKYRRHDSAVIRSRILCLTSLFRDSLIHHEWCMLSVGSIGT